MFDSNNSSMTYVRIDENISENGRAFCSAIELSNAVWSIVDELSNMSSPVDGRTECLIVAPFESN